MPKRLPSELPRKNSRACLTWNDVEVSLNFSQLGFNVVPPNYEISFDWFRRWIKEYDIWFFTAGEGVLESPDGERFSTYPGTAILFRPGDIYYYRTGPVRQECYFFHFDFRNKKTGQSIRADTPEICSLPLIADIIETTFFEACCRRIESLRRREWHTDFAIQMEAKEQANLLLRSMLMEYDLSCRLQHLQPQIGRASCRERV